MSGRNPDVEELERYNREMCDHPEGRLYDGRWYIGYSEVAAIRCGSCNQFVDFGTLATRNAARLSRKDRP